MKARMPLPISE